VHGNRETTRIDTEDPVDEEAPRAEDLIEEIAKVIYVEQSRVGLVPEQGGADWAQMPPQRREPWILTARAAFSALAAARTHLGGGSRARMDADSCASTPLSPLRGRHLTKRERGILSSLSDDATIRQIAVQEFLSRNTVKTHVRNIYRKLGVSDRAGAAAAARMLGIGREDHSPAGQQDSAAT
jgi:DNA-binding CsgD family transcriptional regulator